MHFSIEQILWALVLAAHIVLLVVLMGRERTARFRWFTAWIALAGITLIANHMLHGKLTTIAFYWQTYSLLVLESILGFLMLAELARRIFPNKLKANQWIGWTLITVALAAAAVWAWGPWPSMAEIKAQSAELPLLIVFYTGIKSQLFFYILAVEAGLLFLIFGSRYGSGWRTHAQRIAIGLSTNALAFLAVQGTTDIIAHTVHPKSKQEYDHIIHLITNLENGRTAVWVLVLVWWIVWMWRDQPGLVNPLEPAAEPLAVGTPALYDGIAHPLPETEDEAGL